MVATQDRGSCDRKIVKVRVFSLAPEEKNMKVTNIVQTCNACPSQWNAQTESGRSVYVRYRWGRLTAEVSKEIGIFEYANPDHDWCLVVDEQLGNSLDGTIEWEEVEPYLDEVVLLEECGFD